MSQRPTPCPDLWSRALADLQGQMTQATYNSWMANTRQAALSDLELTISTPNQAALAWLEHRLRPLIERTIARIAGAPIRVVFTLSAPTAPTTPSETTPQAQPVVDPDAAPQPDATAAATLPPQALPLAAFDPARRGWLQTPLYGLHFWQPYLGLGPFSLWLALRTFAQTGAAWPSLQTLADMVANGDKQVLTGRTLRGGHLEGWLERLARERLVWYKRQTNSYLFRVVESLPLLTPAQVATLDPRQQAAHLRWLDQAGLDPDAWSQISLPTLVPEAKKPQRAKAALAALSQ